MESHIKKQFDQKIHYHTEIDLLKDLLETVSGAWGEKRHSHTSEIQFLLSAAKI